MSPIFVGILISNERSKQKLHLHNYWCIIIVNKIFCYPLLYGNGGNFGGLKMATMKFPNGLQVLDDGNTIVLPNGTKFMVLSGELVKCKKEEVLDKPEVHFDNFDYIGQVTRNRVKTHFDRLYYFISDPHYTQAKFRDNADIIRFFSYLKTALEVVDYDFYISRETIQVVDGRIYLSENGIPSMKSVEEWEKLAHNFMPSGNSDIATIYEGVIWLAYSIYQKRWKLEDIFSDSNLMDKWIYGKSSVVESDNLLSSMKLVRFRNGFARIGFDNAITKSPGRVAGKLKFGGVDEYIKLSAFVAIRPAVAVKDVKK